MRIKKRKILLAAFDTLCFCCAALLCGVLLYLNIGGVESPDKKTFLLGAALLFVLTLLLRILFGVYNTIWRYTSTSSYFRLMLADFCAMLLAVLFSEISPIRAGIWFIITTTMINTLVADFSRTVYRLVYKNKDRKNRDSEEKTRKGICIAGAGQLGAILANDLRTNPRAAYTPICFVDNDPSKIGGRISELPIYSSDTISEVMERHNVKTVVIAISNIDGEKLDKIHKFYEDHGCEVKLYASPLQSDKSEDKHVIRDFTIEDVLFRRERSILDDEAKAFYHDKVVLITGGGGSIGSELCRNVAKCGPKRLIIFDICENGAYDIQQELIRKYGREIPLSVEIGSVRDVKRLDLLFRKYRPDVVFHAAAHKHVPLMEGSPAEAIKNNVFGTYNTANMAEKYGVSKFILISTDKAVNPTNVMGASKRVCEMLVECRTDSETSFSAVRFGNVLGSNGSVVPLFKKQIESGGPLTITDKRIIRYFMTIPEASQLVMTAGAMAKRGELFVLDMGKPVLIYDLAVNMIKLSGLVPDRDIEIQEVGLRPGEKLYEELLIKTEHLDKTAHSLIFVERDVALTREAMEEKLASLKEAIRRFEEDGDDGAVKDTMKTAVPTFKDPDEVNGKGSTFEAMRVMSCQA